MLGHRSAPHRRRFRGLTRGLLLLALVPGLRFDPAHAQCRFSETAKLVSSAGIPAEFFGADTAIDGQRVLVGAYGNNHAGSTTGLAYFFSFDGNAWSEDTLIAASDAQAGDRFGFSVDLDGTVAVVGAPLESTVATQAGAVYVYRFDGSNWMEETKLTAFDGARGDLFGRDVAVCGDVIVVGARSDDDLNSNSGSVYVFRFDTGQWGFEQKLTASDGGPGELFGTAVAISGDVLVSGAESHGISAGNPTGAAYVFRYDGDLWLEEQKLTASDAQADDFFGREVSIDGDLLGVGAPGRSGEGRRPAVYLFDFQFGQWREFQTVIGSDTVVGDDFGTSVAIEATQIAVGAQSSAQPNAGQGAAYLFDHNGQFWDQTEKVVSSDGVGSDFFGVSVALSQNVLVAGAHFDDDSGSASGSTYVFSQIAGARRGTVNAGLGNPQNVLFLNGEAGSDPARVVEYNILESFSLEMQAPPALPITDVAPYAVYAWPGTPQLADGRVLPLRIGCTARPIPLTGGSPQPSVTWNNAGRFNRLGFPDFPSNPAPDRFFFRSNGLPVVGTFFIQGVIFDPGSAALVQASVTNGILAVPTFR